MAEGMKEYKSIQEKEEESWLNSAVRNNYVKCYQNSNF